MRIAKPDLTVGGASWALRRVAYRTKLDLGSELLHACQRRVEVIHLEPQHHAVAPRPDVRIAQRAVMVLDLPAVQLEDEPSVAVDQPFIVGSAVVAARPEQPLEPCTCGFDVVDCEEWLWAHDRTVTTTADGGVVVRRGGCEAVSIDPDPGGRTRGER
jgi:hypothetical protein